MSLGAGEYIDAGQKGNRARFINHCCEPNCRAQKWYVQPRTGSLHTKGVMIEMQAGP